MGLRSQIASFFKGRDPREVYGETVVYGGIWNNNNQPEIDQKALTDQDALNATIYALIQRIAEDAASVELQLVRKAADGSVSQVLTDHSALTLLTKHINIVDTPTTFWQSVYADLLAAGNVFAWVMREGGSKQGEPVDILRLPPAEVTPDEDLSKTNNQIIASYTWKAPNGKKETYKPEQIWHCKTRNPNSIYKGLGILPRLRDPLIMEREMIAWQQRQYANDIPLEMYFVGSQPIGNEEARKRIHERFDQRLEGRHNAGRRYAILDGEKWDIKFAPRALQREMQYLEGLQWVFFTYARAFGVPPNKVGDWSESSGLSTNADAQERVYWEATIMQWHRLVLDSLNSSFMPRFYPQDVGKLVWQYDYSKVKALNTSAKEMAEMAEIKVRAAIATPNEVRDDLGMERFDDEAADELYWQGRELGADPLAAFGAGGEPGKPGEVEPDDGGGGGGDDVGKLIRLRAVPRLKMSAQEIVDLEEEGRILTELVAAQIRRMVQLAGEEQLDIAGLAGAFNMKDPEVLSFLARQLVDLRDDVLPTTVELVRLAVADAMAEGLSIVEMRSRLQEAFEVRRQDYQLDRIARTETHQAQEGGGFLAAKQAQLEFKRWITARDDRVRGLEDSDKADHDGIEKDSASKPVPMEAPFVDPRSGAMLQYPGDRQGARSGADVVNCRCSWSADFSHLDEEQKSALGISKSADDLTVIWYRKAQSADRNVAAMKRLLKMFFLQMEKRTLARFDAVAEREGAGKVGAA